MTTAKSIFDAFREVLLMNHKLEAVSAQVQQLSRDMTRVREQIGELQGIIRGVAMASGREPPKLTRE